MDPFKEQNPQGQQQVQVEEAWHREQARKAHDIIRVTNPLQVNMFNQPFEFPVEDRQAISPQFAPNGDYLVEWEGLRYRIPLGGTFEIDRYIALKYCREMFIALVNYYGEKKGHELLAVEGRNKPEILLDKNLENNAVWNKMPKTSDEKLMNEVYEQLWLGMVRENGVDNFVAQNPRSGEVDLKSPEEKLMDQLGNKRVQELTNTSTFVPAAQLGADLRPNEAGGPPLYVSKKERERLAQEVTNDD